MVASVIRRKRASGWTDRPGRGSKRLFRGIAVPLCVGLLLVGGSRAGALATDLDLGEAAHLFRTGQYDECARMAGEETKVGLWSERWAHWKIKAELQRGKYAEALASLEHALRRFPASASLHLLG